MKTKNCPNCGKSYEIQEFECPYCGTEYFDISFIDFESDKPLYLKIKININGQSVYLTQFVRPSLKTIEKIAYEYSGDVQYIDSYQLATDISFNSISDRKGKFMYIETFKGD